jgi:hypothetical protein
MFTEAQVDAIAYALAALRREYKREIRRLERRLLKQGNGQRDA